MRVAHVLRKLDPAQWGGTEMAIQRLFDGLRQQKVEPVIFCPQLEEPVSSDPLVDSGYRVERFKAFLPIAGISPQRRRQMISVGGNLMSFELVSSLWRAAELDMVHTHTLGRIGGIARTVALKRGLPLVVSIHGGVFDLPEKVRQSFHESSEKGWEWGRVFGWLFSAHRLFTDARTIITCNEKEASLMRQRYPGKQVYAQGHGVPMDIYQVDQRAAALAAFPLLANRQVLLCLGRVDPVKNQGWLVERAPKILQRYPGALLVFAGPCTDDVYGEALRQRVRTLGLGDHVLWTGGLAPDTPALIGLLQIARVVLLPSVSETFGLVILEAWAAGAAVISSRTSGGQTHIRHGENGWLFDLDEPNSFFAALDDALSDPQRRREMTRRVTDTVKRDHSLEAVAQRMREIYESTLQEHACAT